jgi:diguanylate cyclase (GGDEF)-like protein
MNPHSIDSLTGAYNRRVLDVAVSQACAAGRTVVVLLADIDRCANMNLVLGHERVDAHIRDVAALLGREGRSDVYRLGGDEFVLIYDNVATATIAGKAIQAAANAEFAYLAQTFLSDMPPLAPVGTLSIAIACGDAPAETFRRVEEACNNAKLRGRNCVEVHRSCADEV